MPSLIRTSDAPATVDASNKLKRTNSDLIATINGVVDHMRAITSQDPYILTIPQDESRYQHHFQYQTIQWLEYTPFFRGEREMMQYQTFHFVEHGKDMFVLENSYESSEHKIADVALNLIPTSTTSGAATPTVKKISLNAYKKKLADTTPSRGDQHRDNPNDMKHQAKISVHKHGDAVPSGSINIHSADKDVKQLTDSTKGKQVEQQGGRSDILDANSSGRPRVKSSLLRNGEALTEPTTLISKKTDFKKPGEDSDSRDRLPPRNLPPRLSPLHIDSLPPRLSPTLPENVMAYLRQRDQRRAAAGPSSSSKGASNVEGNSTQKMKAAKQQTLDKERHEDYKNIQKVESKKLANGDKLPRGVFEAGVIANGNSSPSSLMVKLKVKEHQRELVEKLLSPVPESEDGDTIRCRARPLSSQKNNMAKEATRVTSADRAASQKADLVLGTGARRSEQATASAEKRPLPLVEISSTEPVAKRPRTADRPSTPMQQLSAAAAGKSNKASLQGATRKDNIATATKDLLSDSTVHTPSERRISTPAGGAKIASVTRTTPTVPLGIRTARQEAWEAAQKRLDGLGRELKHEVTDHLKIPHKDDKDRLRSPPTARDQKLAAIKSLESMLTYVLAFICSDQALYVAEPRMSPSSKPWRTLIGFYPFVKHNCDKFRALSGLACLLGVTFSARIMSISAQQPSDAPPRELILEVYGILQRAAQDAETLLDIDTITDVFPTTWSSRSVRETMAELTSLDKPGKFSGAYKLPIGVQTPAVVTARAVHAMLREWLDKQTGLDYQLKLKLDY